MAKRLFSVKPYVPDKPVELKFFVLSLYREGDDERDYGVYLYQSEEAAVNYGEEWADYGLLPHGAVPNV